MRDSITLRVTSFLLLAVAGACAQAPASIPAQSNPVIWVDPGDISSKNLYWGIGGEKHQPTPPFEFVEEDLHGTNPKFDVRDSNDKKWHLKMGAEAQPEVAASRLLWAVGYAANEDYLVKNVHVNRLPAHLHRGNQFIMNGGDITKARLQKRPEHEKKVGEWDWKENPFTGKREFNGLRIMMALIRNWDLKDDNNAILEDDGGQQIYAVSDVGTAFGSPGKRYTSAHSKGNLKEFRRGRLISKRTSDYIDLNFPALPPPLLQILEPRLYFDQAHIRWTGKHIPIADARWIGSLLARISPDQIRDCFRAAGYSQVEVEGYTEVLLSRIEELKHL